MIELILQEAAPGSFDKWVLVPISLTLLVFYFLILRPEKRRKSTREDFLSNLSKNDKIVTTGGIIGSVASVKDREIVIKIDDNKDVKMRVSKAAIVGVYETPKPADQPKK